MTGIDHSDAERIPAQQSAPRKGTKLPRKLRKMLCLHDFEPAARRLLPKPIFGYVAGASEDNRTYVGNRAVFDELDLVPATLVDVSSRRTDTMLFGKRYAGPVGVAPMGLSALTAYRGDIALAKAAREMNLPMVISATGLIALEDIMAVNPDCWFQAYLPPDRDGMALLLDRLRRARVPTLVVTVDSAVVPSRENNVRNGFQTPLKPSLSLLLEGVMHPVWSLRTFLRTFATHGMPHFENSYAERGAPLLSRQAVRDFNGRERLDWEDIAWLRAHWDGRLVLKGILNPPDAARARQAGCDGVILSNHGGRMLDHAISPMRALPAVAEVAGDMTVMIDSGFRRGTDVFKALALGADFVFVGRPFNHAAAIGGAAGVEHAMRLILKEIHTDLGMLGLLSVAELGPRHLFSARFTSLSQSAGTGAV